MYDLIKIGWCDFFEHQIKKHQTHFVKARIVKKHNFGYDLICEKGVYFARLRGKFRETISSEFWPAVGDWVLCTLEKDYAMIEVMIPRKSKISRKVSGKTTEEQVIAANADTIFLVVSLFEDFNPRKIERYLALAAESGAQPILILNKVDLVDDAEYFLSEAQKLVEHIPILLTNALKKETLNSLSQYIFDSQTIVFLGSSGAGKSTIVNALLGEEKQAVSMLGKHKKGKHTTTSRDMLFLPNGGILIDNPGIRELRVWLDGDESLNDSFADIDALAKECRFRNCHHDMEPDCAVQEAIANKKLDLQRLENWRKLQGEAFELMLKRQEFGRNVNNNRSRGISKYIKHRIKSDRNKLR
ncbi:MAG: ribosome small subunit-dependent GTPase A [Brevinema sp.]